MTTTGDHDLDAWLGPALEEMTEDQAERFRDEAEVIAARYPDPDDSREREDAMSATVQWILGEVTVAEVGERLAAARSAMAVAQQVARLAVQDGAAEATTARQVGIDRMTLRRVLGK